MHSTSLISSSSTSALCATLIVSYLLKKFQFDNMYYGMLYGLVMQLIVYTYDIDLRLLMNMTPDVTNHTSTMYYMMLIVTGCLIACGIMAVIKYYNTYDYLKITVCEDNTIEYICNYIKDHKDYYNTKINVNFGDVQLKNDYLLYDKDNTYMRGKSGQTYFEHEQPIIFNDPNLNIKGYFIWKNKSEVLKDKNQQVSKRSNFNYIVFYIQKHSTLPTSEEIISQMINYSTNKNKDKITLYYIKVLETNTNHSVTMYSGVKQPLQISESKYMDSFFHQEKDRLWPVLKHMFTNYEYYQIRGQTARQNLLLHGVGGTGKSSLVYRLAMCLQRTIISLDLRNHDKKSLYQILQRPTTNGGLSQTSPKDVIFLFEEFDISIKELYLREQHVQNFHDSYYRKMIKVMKKCNEDGDLSPVEKKSSNSEFTLRDLLGIAVCN